MKSPFTVLILAAALAAPAFAADEPAKVPTAQQQKMKDCNAEASDKGLKGDERKTFMSTCLKKNKQAAQREKMKTCNADASTKGLKGDERKQFMSSCLSN